MHVFKSEVSLLQIHMPRSIKKIILPIYAFWLRTLIH